jgi:hypothetical protein
MQLLGRLVVCVMCASKQTGIFSLDLTPKIFTKNFLIKFNDFT